MLQKYIKPGNKVELQAVRRINRSDSQDEKKSYSTKVYDILSDERIELLMPLEQTKLILLPVDGEYDLCFYTDTGLFQCNARVVDRYRDNSMYVLALDLTTNLRKFQRREYYRYSCALAMDSRELVKEEIEAFEKERDVLQPGLPLKRSVIVDISGGGLRFVSSIQYAVGSMLLCNYSLNIENNAKEFSIIGKVLAVKESETKAGVYEHRVQYMNVNSDDREGIIKYIFDEERKGRRKEKGL